MLGCGGAYISGLDVILKRLNGLLKVIDGDLLVFDDQVDLKFLDTVANGNQLRSTPDETLHLDRPNVLLHLLEVGLIVLQKLSAAI